jgi:glycerol-3-phosphate cytidylyltransferase
MKKIITYGTFDTFHFGHLELLSRAASLGDHLTIGLSSDIFNQEKNKQSKFNFEKRRSWLESIKFVDQIISEENWQQKTNDILKYNIDALVMGSDWIDKFDYLSNLCEIIYLPRTEGVSSTEIKKL